jgi:uncharacterized protein (TIGR03083 family)
MDPDYGAAYEEARLRIFELARELSEEELQKKVPATPDWTAKDLIAHMVGVAADVSSGNVEGVGSASWTEAQVIDRRPRPIEDILDEWEKLASQIAESIEFFPRTMAAMLAGDLAIHEQDLRGAVDRPGARDSLSVQIGLDTYAFRFRRRIEQEGLPPILISNGDREWVAEGEPAATVTGLTFELFRSLTGRRTPAEMETRLMWTGDSTRYLPLMPLYGIPESSLGE